MAIAGHANKLQAGAGTKDSLGHTERQDEWWWEPTLIIIALAVFLAYGMWTSFQPRAFYDFQSYSSPFQSPILHFLNIDSLNVSPLIAQMIVLGPLAIPFGFRFTCYYFRKAYYRSFFMSPSACTVGKANAEAYNGERGLFVFQNLHRYFMYLAMVLVVLHWIDTVKAFIWQDQLYVGLGSILLLIDAVFLSLYVFSCHAWRHLVGGKIDCFSCSHRNEIRYKGWQRISKLNENHGLWAWISMASIVAADLYIRLVASGAINEIKFIG